MSDLTTRTDALGPDLVGPLAPATAARVLDLGRSAVLATAAVAVTNVGPGLHTAALVVTAGEG